uniref:C2H2-type domain-containing protein n=1 Tax=Chromera velia CCMP2878 TaxID=1169474 RepID=A0A0G4I344_9ALVE|eukprot:Cvel_1746.t1-p1 / transcript=Cvel_1746.t1 / gene=Cvel_1746 / organism=Chromera_velia_CCMP2878 / gene_product=LRR receptor-like serine/threonine-protein kinase, putative / transcript_product=LRR receptor-like serine/threonine-protein kinase, putative / location=Cvel_scaffold63:127738-144689(+) / protein_length=3409 / sequence_SO=supercontig / SO=protein_coding / is_pseudo=false
MDRIGGGRRREAVRVAVEELQSGNVSEYGIDLPDNMTVVLTPIPPESSSSSPPPVRGWGPSQALLDGVEEFNGSVIVAPASREVGSFLAPVCDALSIPLFAPELPENFGLLTNAFRIGAPTLASEAQAMMRLLVHFQWHKFAIAHSDDEYGRDMAAALRTAAIQNTQGARAAPLTVLGGVQIGSLSQSEEGRSTSQMVRDQLEFLRGKNIDSSIFLVACSSTACLDALLQGAVDAGVFGPIQLWPVWLLTSASLAAAAFEPEGREWSENFQSYVTGFFGLSPALPRQGEGGERLRRFATQIGVPFDRILYQDVLAHDAVMLGAQAFIQSRQIEGGSLRPSLSGSVVNGLAGRIIGGSPITVNGGSALAFDILNARARHAGSRMSISWGQVGRVTTTDVVWIGGDQPAGQVGAWGGEEGLNTTLVFPGRGEGTSVKPRDCIWCDTRCPKCNLDLEVVTALWEHLTTHNETNRRAFELSKHRTGIQSVPWNWNPLNVDLCTRWPGVILCHDDGYNLNLGGMELHGEIFPFLGNLSHVKSLDLSRNFLMGPFPSMLPNLCNSSRTDSSLRSLILSDNELKGTLHESLELCVNLQELSVGHNHFTGRLSPGLFNLTELRMLSVEHNNLVGEIPDCFAGCFRNRPLIPHGTPSEEPLTSPDHEENGEGDEPGGDKVSSEDRIVSLDEASYRGWEKDGPFWLRGLLKLNYLRLGRNTFEGNFPSSLQSLTRLTSIEVHSNKLVGRLPDVFWPFQSPRISLRLEENKSLDPSLPLSLAHKLKHAPSSVVLDDRLFGCPRGARAPKVTEWRQMVLPDTTTQVDKNDPSSAPYQWDSCQVCHPCEVGQYSDIRLSECVSCPAGTFSPVNHTRNFVERHCLFVRTLLRERGHHTINASTYDIAFPHEATFRDPRSLPAGGSHRRLSEWDPSSGFGSVFFPDDDLPIVDDEGGWEDLNRLTETSGSGICSSCPPGHFSDVGSSRCHRCSPGTFTAAGGMGCDVCREKTFAPAWGHTHCIKCPDGANCTAEEHSRQEPVSQPGFFRFPGPRYDNTMLTDIGVNCPNGFDWEANKCRRNATLSTSSMSFGPDPSSSSSSSSDWESPKRTRGSLRAFASSLASHGGGGRWEGMGGGEEEIEEIGSPAPFHPGPHVLSASLAVMADDEVERNRNVTQFAFVQCPRSSTCLGNNECHNNSMGILCTECKPGFSSAYFNNPCEACPSAEVTYVKVFLVPIAVIVLVTFVVKYSVNEDQKQTKSGKGRNTSSVIIKIATTWVELTSAAVFLLYNEVAKLPQFLEPYNSGAFSSAFTQWRSVNTTYTTPSVLILLDDPFRDLFGLQCLHSAAGGNVEDVEEGQRLKPVHTHLLVAFAFPAVAAGMIFVYQTLKAAVIRTLQKRKAAQQALLDAPPGSPPGGSPRDGPVGMSVSRSPSPSPGPDGSKSKGEVVAWRGAGIEKVNAAGGAGLHRSIASEVTAAERTNGGGNGVDTGVFSTAAEYAQCEESEKEQPPLLAETNGHSRRPHASSSSLHRHHPGLLPPLRSDEGLLGEDNLEEGGGHERERGAEEGVRRVHMDTSFEAPERRSSCASTQHFSFSASAQHDGLYGRERGQGQGVMSGFRWRLPMALFNGGKKKDGGNVFEGGGKQRRGSKALKQTPTPDTAASGELPRPLTASSSGRDRQRGLGRRGKSFFSCTWKSFCSCVRWCWYQIRHWERVDESLLKGSDDDHDQEKSILSTAAGRTVNLWIITVFLFYPMMTRKFLDNLACTSGEKGSNIFKHPRLRADLSLYCFGEEHLPFYRVALAGVFIWSLGIPLGWFLVLKRNRLYLHAPMVRSRFGFLFVGYETAFYWWEVWTTLRKVLVELPIVIPGIEMNVIYCLLLIISVLSLSLQAHCEPFDNRAFKVCDKLEYHSLWSFFFTLIAIPLLASLDPNDRVQRIGGFLLLYSVATIHVTFLLRCALWFFRPQLRKCWKRAQTPAGVRCCRWSCCVKRPKYTEEERVFLFREASPHASLNEKDKESTGGDRAGGGGVGLEERGGCLVAVSFKDEGQHGKKSKSFQSDAGRLSGRSTSASSRRRRRMRQGGVCKCRCLFWLQLRMMCDQLLSRLTGGRYPRRPSPSPPSPYSRFSAEAAGLEAGRQQESERGERREEESGVGAVAEGTGAQGEPEKEEEKETPLEEDGSRERKTIRNRSLDSDLAHDDSDREDDDDDGDESPSSRASGEEKAKEPSKAMLAIKSFLWTLEDACEWFCFRLGVVLCCRRQGWTVPSFLRRLLMLEQHKVFLREGNVLDISRLSEPEKRFLAVVIEDTVLPQLHKTIDSFDPSLLGEFLARPFVRRALLKNAAEMKMKVKAIDPSLLEAATSGKVNFIRRLAGRLQARLHTERSKGISKARSSVSSGAGSPEARGLGGGEGSFRGWNRRSSGGGILGVWRAHRERERDREREREREGSSPGLLGGRSISRGTFQRDKESNGESPGGLSRTSKRSGTFNRARSLASLGVAGRSTPAVLSRQKSCVEDGGPGERRWSWRPRLPFPLQRTSSASSLPRSPKRRSRSLGGENQPERDRDRRRSMTSGRDRDPSFDGGGESVNVSPIDGDGDVDVEDVHIKLAGPVSPLPPLIESPHQATAKADNTLSFPNLRAHTSYGREREGEDGEQGGGSKPEGGMGGVDSPEVYPGCLETGASPLPSAPIVPVEPFRALTLAETAKKLPHLPGLADVRHSAPLLRKSVKKRKGQNESATGGTDPRALSTLDTDRMLRRYLSNPDGPKKSSTIRRAVEAWARTIFKIKAILRFRRAILEVAQDARREALHTGLSVEELQIALTNHKLMRDVIITQELKKQAKSGHMSWWVGAASQNVQTLRSHWGALWRKVTTRAGSRLQLQQQNDKKGEEPASAPAAAAAATEGTQHADLNLTCSPKRNPPGGAASSCVGPMSPSPAEGGADGREGDGVAEEAGDAVRDDSQGRRPNHSVGLFWLTGGSNSYTQPVSQPSPSPFRRTEEGALGSAQSLLTQSRHAHAEGGLNLQLIDSSTQQVFAVAGGPTQENDETGQPKPISSERPKDHHPISVSVSPPLKEFEEEEADLGMRAADGETSPGRLRKGIYGLCVRSLYQRNQTYCERGAAAANERKGGENEGVVMREGQDRGPSPVPPSLAPSEEAIPLAPPHPARPPRTFAADADRPGSPEVSSPSSSSSSSRFRPHPTSQHCVAAEVPPRSSPHGVDSKEELWSHSSRRGGRGGYGGSGFAGRTSHQPAAMPSGYRSKHNEKVSDDEDEVGKKEGVVGGDVRGCRAGEKDRIETTRGQALLPLSGDVSVGASMRSSKQSPARRRLVTPQQNLPASPGSSSERDFDTVGAHMEMHGGMGVQGGGVGLRSSLSFQESEVDCRSPLLQILHPPMHAPAVDSPSRDGGSEEEEKCGTDRGEGKGGAD